MARKNEVILEGSEKSKKEDEADVFARNCLIAPEQWKLFIKSERFDHEGIPDEFNCLIQTDEYSCYNKLNKELELPAHARCWAHARRKFMDAPKQREHPRRLGWIIHQIGLLYGIEKRLREQKAGPALREAVRQSESHPIIDRLFKLWKTMQLSGTYKPQTLTGKALSYALGIEVGLKVYLDHGQVEIDKVQRRQVR